MLTDGNRTMNTQALITGNADAPRTLIAVFLRGGADGLSLVAPLEDDAYFKARPRLGIAKHNYRNVLAPILARHGANADELTRTFPEFTPEPLPIYG